MLIALRPDRSRSGLFCKSTDLALAEPLAKVLATVLVSAAQRAGAKAARSVTLRVIVWATEDVRWMSKMN
jgi:hypothetical protein